MIKKLIVLTCAAMLGISAYAQDKCEGFGPKKGDLTMSATIGYNSYAGMNAPTTGLSSQYEVAALSTDWFDKGLMVGVEGSWFFSDNWSWRLGGGLGFTNNPGYAEVTGTFDENDNDPAGNVPTYRAVADAQTFKYNVYTGVDRHIQHKNLKNLYFHVGLHAGFAYGLNQTVYDETTSMGKMIGEAFNVRGAVNTGVSYYVLPGMFLGVEVNALQYTYNMTTIKPQEGLANLSADSHNVGFLAAPTLKIGFKF